jgi:hypothetical protein
LFPEVVDLIPSEGGPTRRGSEICRVEVVGEVDCRSLVVGDTMGIDIRDSIFLEEPDVDTLRGIGMLVLDGREFIAKSERSKARYRRNLVCRGRAYGPWVGVLGRRLFGIVPLSERACGMVVLVVVSLELQQQSSLGTDYGPGSPRSNYASRARIRAYASKSFILTHPQP